MTSEGATEHDGALEQGRSDQTTEDNRPAVPGEDRDREGSSGAGQADATGTSGGVQQPAEPGRQPLTFPRQSPLFHAQNSARYDRQQLIGIYQETFDCRLIVMIDEVFPDSIALLEDLLFDAEPGQDLHLLLHSPGGDGETAIRLIRSMQSRCRELTVLVPDQAKSAATLMVLGAHHIVMGPTSDLGPVDPQFRVPRQGGGHDLVAAKDIIEAVERAERAVAEEPATFPLHSALLADVTGLMVATARSAILRTDDLVVECLSSCSERSEDEIRDLAEALHTPLIEAPRSHSAVFDADAATGAGLPIRRADPTSEQWQLIWRLYMKYRTLPPAGIYEGKYASQIMRVPS